VEAEIEVAVVVIDMVVTDVLVAVTVMDDQVVDVTAVTVVKAVETSPLYPTMLFP